MMKQLATKGKNSTPLLRVAIQTQDLNKLKSLLTKKGTDPNQIYFQDGLTPLGLISFFEDESLSIEFAKSLIFYGANVNKIDNCGDSPIRIATLRGKKLLVHYFLSNGAQIEQLDKFGRSPLFTAVEILKYKEKGDLELVKFLLSEGANPNHISHYSKFTPLHFACYGPSNLVKLLIENGADLNATTIDKNLTPLHLACSKGKINSVKLLLQATIVANTSKKQKVLY